MGNLDLVERTGLSSATVSRLTQTLVKTGMLEHDQRSMTYRLSAALLSLGHAVSMASPVLKFSTPIIQIVAKKNNLNIGIAVRDLHEMVYLDVIRFNRKKTFRNVVSGHRVPLESTSLGHAYLASISEAARKTLMTELSISHHSDWYKLHKNILKSIKDVKNLGYCAVPAWQPGTIAIATPLRFKHHQVHVLNVSGYISGSAQETLDQLGPMLLDLANAITNHERNL